MGGAAGTDAPAIGRPTFSPRDLAARGPDKSWIANSSAPPEPPSTQAPRACMKNHAGIICHIKSSLYHPPLHVHPAGRRKRATRSPARLQKLALPVQAAANKHPVSDSPTSITIQARQPTYLAANPSPVLTPPDLSLLLPAYTNESIRPATVRTPPTMAHVLVRKWAKLWRSSLWITIKGEISARAEQPSQRPMAVS